MNQFLVQHRTLVIAHRGACAYAPENTLSAFRLAVEQGADAVELDAKLSADGEVMVIHDQTVDRTTDGNGTVRRMTLGQLKSLDAGKFFSSKYTNEPIPTLAEVFETVGQQILINVELTNYTSINDGLVEKVVDLVRRCQLEDRVMFSSFHPINLVRARRLLPEVPVGILALEGRAGWWARSFLLRHISPEFVHPYFTDASAGFIRRQHESGRKVNVWTVNDPGDLSKLSVDGVDGLITDDPIAGRRAVEVH
ncbi:MAG: glycerophosphodiester phosphodiesterase [Anaerolineae bacterium]|nr:glycerophosphodiester phosphodiesterase [Anaerolineae bacterium]